MADVTMTPCLYSFVSTKFNLSTINTSSGPSSFNPIASISGPSAEIWTAELVFHPRRDEDIDELMQFVMRLKGGKNDAVIYDYFRTARSNLPQPRGAGGLGPVANIAVDAPAGSDFITIKNLKPNELVALKTMDHLGIGGNLHAVLFSGPSDADGEGTFEIRPVLRKGVAVDDPVDLVKPTARFTLVSGETDLVQYGRPHIYTEALTLAFQERPDFDA